MYGGPRDRMVVVTGRLTRDLRLLLLLSCLVVCELDPFAGHVGVVTVGVALRFSRAMMSGMRTGRVVLVVTLLVVAGLGVWFALAQWNQANRAATMSSALGAVGSTDVPVGGLS